MPSKIVIGTVQFGLDYGISNREGRTSHAEVTKILRLAKENEISTLDTAHAYGDSESALGRNDLSDFKVVSKFPRNPEKPINELLQVSLDRLKVDSLYAYMAHHAEDLIEKLGLLEDLTELKSEKKVDKIGCSLYYPQTLEKLWACNFQPDIVQIPFNVFDQRFAPLLPKLKAAGCEVHARSVFLQGIFFSEIERLHPFFNPMKESIRRIQQAFPNQADRAAQLIRFCLSNQGIDQVVIGVNSARQLAENLKALSSNPNSQIEPEEMNEELIMPHLWPQRN